MLLLSLSPAAPQGARAIGLSKSRFSDLASRFSDPITLFSPKIKPMTRQQALDFWYSLQSLASYLHVDKHYGEAERARTLAEDLSLIHHLTSEEIQTGVLKK